MESRQIRRSISQTAGALPKRHTSWESPVSAWRAQHANGIAESNAIRHSHLHSGKRPMEAVFLKNSTLSSLFKSSLLKNPNGLCQPQARIPAQGGDPLIAENTDHHCTPARD